MDVNKILSPLLDRQAGLEKGDKGGLKHFTTFFDSNIYIKVGSVFLIILLWTNNLTGQQLPEEKRLNLEDLIEEIARNSDLDIDYTLLYEDLLYLEENPVNINTATQEDLQRLRFLTEFQARSLVAYIQQHGPILSLFELQLIEGLDPETIRMLIPFIMIEQAKPAEQEPLLRSINKGKHQLIIRGDRILEEKKGYASISDSAYEANPNSRYLGSPLKAVLRYRYHYKDRVYWGITAEKDAGEEFFTGSNKQGFDFYSGHLLVNDIGKIKTIALGDYHLRFGQGLTLWSGISYGKTPYVLSIKKKQYGITKYSSTEENRFLRGAGTTISLKNLDISAFYSRKKIDANIQYLDTLHDEIENVTSFQVTGYHSIPSEVDDEDAINESIAGGNLSYGRGNFHVGLTLVNYQFGEKLMPDERPYNRFDFRGNSNTNIGFDYQAGWNRVNLFGEISHSLGHGIAYLNGLLLNLHSLISISLLYRDYQRDYYPFYSQAISENSTNKNERGVYLGTEIRPLKHLKISAYYDAFWFPWLKYNVDAPSRGMDYMVRFDYTPSETLEIYCSLKEESKPRNRSVDVPSLNEIVDTRLTKFRFQLGYWVSPTLQLRSRIELTQFLFDDDPLDYGYMVFQDILFRPKDLPLSVSFRYAMFDTDSWDTRIYAYEHDLLYAFSIPALHQSGMRTYLLVKYSPLNYMDLWIRLAQTYYSHVQSIGTGLNEISGKTKTEVKVQMQLKF